MIYILSEHEEKKFSKINPKIKPLAEMLKLTLLDELPQNPEVGKWYRYTPDGCICANGKFVKSVT